MDAFSARAIIRARKEEVWGVFTDPRTWETWYGGALLGVEPAWQAGAKLNWRARVARGGNHAEMRQLWSRTRRV